MQRIRVVTFLVAVGLSVCAAPVDAQQGTMSDQDRQEFLNYPLTMPRANALIAAMQEMTAYMVSRPDLSAVMARSAKMTRAELIAQMEKDPKSMAIVTPHGLKAKDYIYGVPALRMALMAAQGLSAPTIVASPANLAFAKANLAQLKPKMDAAEGRGRQ